MLGQEHAEHGWVGDFLLYPQPKHSLSLEKQSQKHLNGNLIPVLAFIVGASLISTFSTTVVFRQRLLPQNIGLASGLLLGFGVGMGSIGVTLLGAIADYAGLPFTMNIVSLLPILGIVLAFTLPDIRAGQSVAGKALQQQA